MPATTYQRFPATVTMPDESVLTPVLVFGSPGRVEVYGSRHDFPIGADTRSPNVVLVTGWDTDVTSDGGQDRIDTGDGFAVVSAAGGCGCSHPCKGFRP
jgi:hypothetical protein